jgi:hypothetical protein
MIIKNPLSAFEGEQQSADEQTIAKPAKTKPAKTKPAKTKPAKTKSAKTVAPIAKPSSFSLDKFKSKRAAAIANVETLLTALPVYRIADAEDFVRLHPDEEHYWSDELCFVSVPIKGSKKDTLHLIDEDLAMRFLPSGRIQHFRLALASKPFDIFFLCHEQY